MFLSSFDDIVQYWETLEIMTLKHNCFKKSSFQGDDLLSFFRWYSVKMYQLDSPRIALSFLIDFQCSGLPGISTSSSEAGRCLSWHYWEHVREASTRNCTNDSYCGSYYDEGDGPDLFQPDIHLLFYILCIDAHWKCLELPAKDIDVSHWNIKKQQTNANWTSHTFHSQHLETYIRSELFSVSTPAMLIQLTLNINSLWPSNSIHALVITRCLIRGVSKNLFCSWRKDISLYVQRAPQQLAGGSMYWLPALFPRYLFKEAKIDLC